jgi:hypothetical protein
VGFQAQPAALQIPRPKSGREHFVRRRTLPARRLTGLCLPTAKCSLLGQAKRLTQEERSRNFSIDLMY